MEHSDLVLQHVSHGEVLEDAAPSGIGILEVADHLPVNVQVFL